MPAPLLKRKEHIIIFGFKVKSDLKINKAIKTALMTSDYCLNGVYIQARNKTVVGVVLKEGYESVPRRFKKVLLEKLPEEIKNCEIISMSQMLSSYPSWIVNKAIEKASVV